MTTTINLTPQQQQQILETSRQQALLIGTANVNGAISNNQFVLFFGFDGTNNDLFNRPQTTNVAQLASQVASARSPDAFSKYYAGPGTKGTLTASAWFSPQVTQQVTNTARQAYATFVSQAGSRLLDSPTTSIAVALTSFSRGAASAVIFSQLIYANGLVAEDGRILIAPGQIPISAGVIFDPVLTGVVGNMAFAPNTHNLVDIVARNEYRLFFESADYSNQSDILTIIPVFGSHTDVGGGYDNGLSALTLEAGTQFLQRSGLAIDPVPISREYAGPLLLHSESDSVWWHEYAQFFTTDISVDQRHQVNFATPAALTTLLGRQAQSLLLFDGRTITISDKDNAGIEKVKIDSRITSSIDAHEITTYRIATASTVILNKIAIRNDKRLDTQTIKAAIVSGSLDINVPAAHSTLLTIVGADRVNRNGALILGENPAGFRVAGGKFQREGTSTVSTWRDTESGLTYRLVGGTLDDGKGSLRVTGAPIGTQGNSITIDNFVDGKVGISFADRQGIKVASSGKLGEGGASSVTVKSDSVSDQDRVIKVLASGSSSDLAAELEGEFRPMAAGELDLVLPAGQSQLSFALLQRGDIDTSGSVDLTARLLNTDGTTAASSSQSFLLRANVELTIPPATTRDILGGYDTGTDDLGNHFTGTFDPDRADVLNDSTGNDHIMAGGGDDLLFATQGGDDWIELGAGADTANAGSGNDLVAGGEGADVLFGGIGDDRLFAGEVVDPDVAIASGVSAADGGSSGDFLNGNEGADLVTGSDQANILEGGAGDDRIAAGGGDDVVESDGDIRNLTLGASFTVTAASATDPDGSAAGTLTIGGSASRFVVDAPGEDVVHAGNGADYVFAGGGDDVAYGEDGADCVFGESGDDAIFGGDGDDVLSGDNGGSVLDYTLHGDDFLDGGAGDDKLFGDGGSDTLYGGGGNDILIGDSSGMHAGDDYLSGDAGDDQLQGGMGEDTLLGGDGGDTLIGDNGGTDPSGAADFLDGGSGDDRLRGQGGNDTLVGGSGVDFLQGDDGDDMLDGGEDADTLLGGAGEDVLAGGAGNDILVGDNGGSDASGEADFLDGGAGDDTLAGQGGDDMLIGGEGSDIVDGGDGSDVLDGAAGDDTLQGWAGDDWLDGGDGADTVLGGQGEDRLSGGGGNDLLLGDDGITDPLGGADFIEGGEGDDQLFGQVGDDRLVGDAGSDLLDGGDGNDTLEGAAGDDRLAGGPGDDLLDGGDGVDFIDGGTGNDTLAGGDGQDVYSYDFLNGGVDYLDDTGANILLLHAINPTSLRLNLGSLVLSGGNPDNQLHLENFDADDVAAGAGVDLFVFDDGTTLTYAQLLARGIDVTGTPDDEVIEGTSGDDAMEALGGDDVVIAKAGDDSIRLGAGNDIAEAADGNDVVMAGEGADILLGGAGNDRLFGESGDDQLYGHEGDDALTGGEGADILVGGPGDDIYVVDSLDTVVEERNAGIDTVEAGVDYALPDNVENLLLLGTENNSGIGNALGNVIAGNDGNNRLSGLGGNDSLDGGAGADVLDGGTDADTLRGGAGNDLYIVDDPRDGVVEHDLWSPGSFSGGPSVERMGHDAVQSSISFGLPRFVEDLTLIGTAGIDGSGNAEQNVIVGNEGRNELVSTRLDGLNDNLVSGPGAVLYLGAFPTGRDERLWDRALALYFRGDIGSDDIESVSSIVQVDAGPGDTLIGNGGDDRLIGGWDDDTLDGGAGNDFLVGSGGRDAMLGGEGDDVYLVDRGFNYDFGYADTASIQYVDDSVDQVIEDADGGIDTVYSNVQEYWLEQNVENLNLLDEQDLAALRVSAQDGLLSGGVAMVGFGNDLENVVTGNAFDNALYGGAGDDTLWGNDGNDQLDGESGADLMAGGLGNDTYYVDDGGDAVVEDALPGYDGVNSAIDYTLPANVEWLQLGGDTHYEDLMGTGNELDNALFGNYGANALSGAGGDDYLFGDQGSDTLYGGDGDDQLDGGPGSDVMSGGAGDDSYIVDDAGDTASENVGEGHDLVSSSVAYALGSYVEDLQLRDVDSSGNFVGAIDGMGNDLPNRIIGNDSNNVLSGLGGDDAISGGDGWDVVYGGDGNDELDGGERADVLIGGGGDDLFIADTFYEVIVEAADEGVDRVISSETFALPDNVENLTLLGDYAEGAFAPPLGGFGNSLANLLTGNDGSNRLDGKAGDDTIDGRAGGDSIDGGEGDDVLYGGEDAILVASSFGGVFGEDGRPIKRPNAYRVFDILASNSDFIRGGRGDDRLDGGSGNDRLYGDDGDDVLYGGDDGLWVDTSHGMVDPVDDGSRVDEQHRLFLSNNDQLYGGDGDDALDGGSGNDELHGDEGVDAMAGGPGDDRFFVDGTFVVEPRDIIDDCGELISDVPTRIWTSDTVLEKAGEGYDAVFAFAEITLPDYVEALYLEEGAYLQFAAGSAQDNAIYGNSNDNDLRGGGGNDVLFGNEGDDILCGGPGDDVLYGGPGTDIYDFGSGDGRDVVYNFGGGFDFVHMTGGISPDAVALSSNGSDVTIGCNGTDDRLTLAGWFDDPVGHIREIEFCDGTVLEEADIALLASRHTIAAADDFASVAEDDASITGNLLANDAGTGAFLSIADPRIRAGEYGTLAIDADGVYAYVPGDVQWLSEGESATDVFTYETQDEVNAHDAANLIIDVLGRNDAPLFGPNAGSGYITEDVSSTIVEELGNEVVNGDFDSFSLFGWSIEGNGRMTGVTDGPSGGVAYSGTVGGETVLSQEVATFAGEDLLVRFRLLGGGNRSAGFTARWNGETLTALEDVVVGDYTEFVHQVRGAAGSSQLQFAMRNDADFWYLDDIQVAPFQRHTSVPDLQRATGTLLFTDVDLSDVHFVARVEAQADDYLGELSVDLEHDSAFGQSGLLSWSFEVPNEELQFLSEGQTLSQTYDITLSDGFGATAVHDVTVLLHGANDAPIAHADDATVQEDIRPQASGNVLANDSDIDTADSLLVLEAGTYRGQFGTLDLARDGTYRYTLDSAAVDFLGCGDKIEEAFDYQVIDGASANPLTAAAVLTLNIDGSNDAPTARGDFAIVSEDAVFDVSGNVLSNDSDPDQGTVLSVVAPRTYIGSYGTLLLNGDGSYLYTLANESHFVQALGAGEVASDVFTYDVSDDLATAEATLTVTIVGQNDAPVTIDDAASVSEDGILIASGNVLANDTDTDRQTVLTVANAGTYGSLMLAEDGSYIYALDNESTGVQALGAGQKVHEIFAYMASDGIADAAGTLTLTVEGANDAPSVPNPIGDRNVQASATFAFSFAQDAFFDIDKGDVLSYAASLADGTALPDWLSFDSSTRTFVGASPSQGAAQVLGIRVTAIDPWGASAVDDFDITVVPASSTGQHILGTAADDVLSGTPYADVIDGAGGYDVMSGGLGDDTYYVAMNCSQGNGNEGLGNGEDPPPPGHDHNMNDGSGTSPGHPASKTTKHDDPHDNFDDCSSIPQCRPDLVIEQADAGYDVVYAAVDYTLTDHVEELRLLGNADLRAAGNVLDNVLVGNSGDNMLAGGLGDDMYRHELHGGDDVIEEEGGDSDVLALGVGITPEMVTLKRRRDDLMVDIAGSHDSVAVKDWFASKSKRVELIEFADGTAWDVEDIQGGVQEERGCLPPSPPRDCDNREHRGDHHDVPGHDERGAQRNHRDPVAQRIEERLCRTHEFDFQQVQAPPKTQTEHDIAAQWRKVAAHSYEPAVGHDYEVSGPGSFPSARPPGALNESGGMGFGFEAAIGASRGHEDLKRFHGLGEGFRRL